ncbi:MAG: glycosyltransferase family 2 protein [Cytophagales bacterium]|nr:glycosyltransferase family 2 protein [Cytophagales bacterium]
MIPKVSVIIPCYNAAEYLDRSIQSIRKQSLSQWEMILIDDSSSDATSKLCREYTYQDMRIRYLRHSINQGPSAARNTGIQHAKAPYITLLDAEDEYLPSYLKKSLNILSHQPNINMVQCHMIMFKYDIEKRLTEKIQLPMQTNMPPHLHLDNMHLVGTCTFRKTCWQAVGGYETKMRFGEDWHFFLCLLEKGLLNYAVIPEYLFYHHRINPNSLSESVDLKRQKKSAKMIYHTHKSLYQKNLSKIFLPHLFRLLRQPSRHPRQLICHPIRLAIRYHPRFLYHNFFFWGTYILHSLHHHLRVFLRRHLLLSQRRVRSSQERNLH